MIAVWILVAIALTDFTINTAFLAVSSAKRLRDSGVPMTPSIKATVYFLLLVGVPADGAFNAGRGSLMFREFPKWTRGEFMFSHRVQRHVNNGPGDGWRYRKALEWAAILNAIDHEHIRIPS